MRRAGPEELTDRENKELLATFTSRSLQGVAVERANAKVYQTDPDTNPQEFIDAVDNLLAAVLDEYTRRSGSLGGEHRRDLKEALIGSPATSTGVSLNVQNGNQQPPPNKTEKRGL